VLAAAGCSNIHVKYSGIGNVAAIGQEYPYPDLHWIIREVSAAFGPARLIWGSDFPVSRRHMTYAQSLSLVTRHGPFAGDDLAGVLGGNLSKLLLADVSGTSQPSAKEALG
jgi:L-fuconolactonase